MPSIIKSQRLQEKASSAGFDWDNIEQAWGKFQEELDDVPCVYGTLKPVRTWYPILITFQHLWFLTQDAWYTSSIKDKLKIWFMPTGWRPEDVEEKIKQQ